MQRSRRARPISDFGHLGERFAVAAHGEQQNHEILHAAAEDGARENPETCREDNRIARPARGRPAARARRWRRSDVRRRPTCWCGTKSRPFSRRSAGVARRASSASTLGRDEFAVEAVADRVAADRGHHQPHGVDLFAAMERDGCNRERTANCDRHPHRCARRLRHGENGLRCKVTRPGDRLSSEYCGESRRGCKS